jgi:mRNA interferase RelE/StbE
VTGEAAAPFEIYWAPPARRALRRLPEKVATAAIDPTRVGRDLRFELEGAFSAHRGDYRVVNRIDEQARRVEVLAIGHRADVYRRD